MGSFIEDEILKLRKGNHKLRNIRTKDQKEIAELKEAVRDLAEACKKVKKYKGRYGKGIDNCSDAIDFICAIDKALKNSTVKRVIEEGGNNG